MPRQRSPNYPNLSLEEALGRVRKVFEADRTAPLDREVVAKHMGYAGKSGASDKTLGGVAQYGLLESVGKGEARVTRLAVDIFHPLDQNQRRRALHHAAYLPEIFKDLRGRFGAGAPSEPAMRSYLVRQNFLDRAITPIIAAYLSNCQLLLREHAIESDSQPEAADEESTSDAVESEEPADPLEAANSTTLQKFRWWSQNLEKHRTSARDLEQRVLTKGLLSKGSTFEIIVSGQIGKKEIDMLIRKLELDKEILAESGDDVADD